METIKDPYTPQIEWNYVDKGDLILVQGYRIDDTEKKLFTQRAYESFFKEHSGYNIIAGFRVKKVKKEFLKWLNFEPNN